MEYFTAGLVSLLSLSAGAQAPQWDDFPGGRTVELSGYTWRVKGPGVYGPGPNFFWDRAPSVEELPDGSLALRITFDGARWRSVEVVNELFLGYGTYRFRLDGPVDVIDPNAVLGLFLWEYQESYDGIDQSNIANEFDIELSRWGQAFNQNAQFVAQPYHRSGNLERFGFALPQGGAPTTFEFDWGPDRVHCRAWAGHAGSPTAQTLYHEWTYQGPDIPELDEPRVHMNLWLVSGNPPLSVARVEVIVSGFEFIPACPPDVNANGFIEPTDFGAWLAAFNAGLPPADQNRDGEVTPTDFGAWIANYNAGCE